MSCKTECTEQKDRCSCGNKILQNGSHSIAADFEVCLPFGGRLYSMNGAVHYEAPSNPPRDGVYTNIVVRNGCIIEAGHADLSTYTSAPCAPIPADCHCAGASSSISNAGSPTVIRGGDGVSVVGNGTANNPYVISANAGTSSGSSSFGSLISGNAAIAITSSGNTYTIEHETPIEDGTIIMGMQFNRFGHLIGYSAPTEVANIRQIQTGTGLTVSTDIHTGVATLDIAPVPHRLDPVTVGGVTFTFDEYGRVYNVSGGGSGSGGDSGSTTVDSGKSVCHAMTDTGDTSDVFNFNLLTESYVQVTAFGGPEQNIVCTLDGDTSNMYRTNAQSGHFAGVSKRPCSAGAHTMKVVRMAVGGDNVVFTTTIATVSAVDRV